MDVARSHRGSASHHGVRWRVWDPSRWSTRGVLAGYSHHTHAGYCAGYCAAITGSALDDCPRDDCVPTARVQLRRPQLQPDCTSSARSTPPAAQHGRTTSARRPRAAPPVPRSTSRGARPSTWRRCRAGARRRRPTCTSTRITQAPALRRPGPFVSRAARPRRPTTATRLHR